MCYFQQLTSAQNLFLFVPLKTIWYRRFLYSFFFVTSPHTKALDFISFVFNFLDLLLRSFVRILNRFKSAVVLNMNVCLECLLL